METLPTRYNVFLSFRGADDRTGFVYHLYKRLLDSGVRVSRNDCALPVCKEKGTEQLVWAISRCKIAIPIISRGYASSTWCLEELAMIMDCRRRDDKLVFPVFYNVDVVDLGRRRGDFDDEMKCSSEEVLKWQEALTSVARIRGWISQSTADGYVYFVLYVCIYLFTNQRIYICPNSGSEPLCVWMRMTDPELQNLGKGGHQTVSLTLFLHVCVGEA
ncbi:hypothetical protein EUGRSUZ_L02320 [Eucalyptus grandis]|uniref:ADP-ribosyl cyclase/cyclic ADP-ribose hydrolase n=1 Tax=Eucalyptus grandis TaxID=71139 RepID=A0A058ZS46_EUCGR|nr:hypothetical protein EUGRSUZ_L02320 [Eucalyptus grandis]